MGAAQFFKRQGRGQGTGIPDLEPILKEHDLDAGIAGVVAMDDGIDDGLGDDFLRNFVFRRRLGAFRSCSHPEVYLGEHEILGLIHEEAQPSRVPPEPRHSWAERSLDATLLKHVAFGAREPSRSMLKSLADEQRKQLSEREQLAAPAEHAEGVVAAVDAAASALDDVVGETPVSRGRLFGLRRR